MLIAPEFHVTTSPKVDPDRSDPTSRQRGGEPSVNATHFVLLGHRPVEEYDDGRRPLWDHDDGWNGHVAVHDVEGSFCCLRHFSPRSKK
jgi:hypothetical protein